MPSLRRHEGYLLIDHSNSPGLSEELVRAAGLPPGAGQGVFEAPTYTCSHCGTVVVMNPDRKRERAYCSSCDHLICDRCGAIYGATRECKPFAKIIDETQEAAAKQTDAAGAQPLTLITP